MVRAPVRPTARIGTYDNTTIGGSFCGEIICTSLQTNLAETSVANLFGSAGSGC
jgi:hypothetical protein